MNQFILARINLVFNFSFYMGKGVLIMLQFSFDINSLSLFHMDLGLNVHPDVFGLLKIFLEPLGRLRCFLGISLISLLCSLKFFKRCH